MYITSVIPSGNAPSGGAVLVTETVPSTRSDAVAGSSITVVVGPVASADTSAGAVITGAILSVIVTS